MIMIRLSPTGRKKRITYRVVVSEKRSKLNGKVIDDLGFYDGLSKPPKFVIDQEKLNHWQKQGAHLSETVRALLPLIQPL